MYLLMVNHDVEDYDRWKVVYDSLDQGSWGAETGQVSRNVDNPANVSVVHGFETLERATTFRDSPELRSAMQEAGVAGPPRIEILEEIQSEEY